MLSREETLLITLKGKFASQFNKHFGDMNPEMINMVFQSALVGVSDEQFQVGLNRLLAPGNKFMPDLAEFQNWCVSGSWWTATEAWQRACDYSNDSSLKITKLAKKAWDSVYWLVEQGSMKAASSEFKSIYETYLAKAQMQGRQQEWYVPPVMIETKARFALSASDEKPLNNQQQEVVSLTNQNMAKGMPWKKAFEAAQMEVYGEVKLMHRGVA